MLAAASQYEWPLPPPERPDLVTETVEVAVMAEQAAGSMCRDRCDRVDAGDFAMGGGAGAS